MDFSQLLTQLKQINLSRFLVYLPTLISVFYIFYKGLNIKITKKKLLALSLFTIIISYIIILTEYSYNNHSKILALILASITLMLVNNKDLPVFVSLPASIVSLGLTSIFRMLSFIVCGILCFFSNIPYTHIMWGVLIAVIQILLGILFMRIKRFKNGFSFFKEKNHSDIGLIFSSAVLFITIILNNKNYISQSMLPPFFLALLILFTGIFMWIKRSINQKYLDKLNKKELEKYRTELKQKEEEIDNLTSSNTALAKIVHRDNHLVTTLNHTITKHLNSNENNTSKLLREILTMLNERSELVLEEQLSNKILPTTDISIIDGTLSTVLTSCISHKINFDVTIQCKPTYIVNKLISQTNLQTLLCDHLKDAIISIISSDIANGNISLNFAMLNGIYEITIKDNGCEFSIDTLQKLGLQSVTTHKDTGGTGMGFLTTFKTLKDCNASIIITEYKAQNPYSKSIAFSFDGNSSFIINSYRYNQLKEQITRTDVTINSIE